MKTRKEMLVLVVLRLDFGTQGLAGFGANFGICLRSHTGGSQKYPLQFGHYSYWQGVRLTCLRFLQHGHALVFLFLRRLFQTYFGWTIHDFMSTIICRLALSLKYSFVH